MSGFSTRRHERTERFEGHASLEGGVLEVVTGPHRGRSFVVAPPRVRIGSGPDNDIVLGDDTVSRRHAVIDATNEGLLLRDAGSTNGLYVGNARVREAYLTHGLAFALGATTLVFRPHEITPPEPDLEPDRFGPVVGRSPGMLVLYELLRKAASTSLSMLVTGETGTGKELVARAIHLASPRRAGPFVVFDASAVSRDLIESALFGHRAGAFTGAQADRLGAFASAHGGTLFIDELGELPLDLQPRLLRALEAREIQPLGADRVQSVDVRVVAVTNRPLKQMVLADRFRQDLFYRLSVIHVVVPPLRERREDIPLLVRHLLGEIGAPSSIVSEAAWTVLMGHAWPGNVRELKNTLERAITLCERRSLGPEHLHLEVEDAPVGPAQFAASLAGPPRVESIDEAEIRAIREALRAARWNKSEAARLLGMNRKTLRLKIEKYRIEP